MIKCKVSKHLIFDVSYNFYTYVHKLDIFLV